MTRQRGGSELVDEVARLRAENHQLREQRRELRRRVAQLEDGDTADPSPPDVGAPASEVYR